MAISNDIKALISNGNWKEGRVTHKLKFAGGNDRLFRDSGNDEINGGKGDDYLIGGTGNDRLYGNSGNDRLYGGSGNDYLNGGTGSDRMYGGTGNDRYVVDSTGDRIIEYANGGYDHVYSSLSSYTLGTHVEHLTLTGTAHRGVGNSSNNKMTGNASSNYLYGAAGQDVLYGLDGNDNLVGGSGFDQLFGGNGTDYLNGGLGSDHLYGGAGNDVYLVDTTNTLGTGDRIFEGKDQGIDTVYASPGIYNLEANVENLVLIGRAGVGNGNSLDNNLAGNFYSNRLYGFSGDDIIYGFGGNNTLDGGSGNDTIIGGVGDDLLVGGTGTDMLMGGAGADKFQFNSAAEGVDYIADFVQVQGDKIEILASGFDGGLTKGLLDAGQFLLGSSSTSADHRFLYNQSTGALSFDSDGSGAKGAVQFATVSAGLSLTHTDIAVI